MTLTLTLFLTLPRARWAKLVKDFYKPKKDTFDTTKVPDLYDNALYDMVHNRHLEPYPRASNPTPEPLTLPRASLPTPSP